MGKKKKKLKKRCCGKYLKEGKHCSNCPVAAGKAGPEGGIDTERTEARGKRIEKKQEKKGKKSGRKKKN